MFARACSNGCPPPPPPLIEVEGAVCGYASGEEGFTLHVPHLCIRPGEVNVIIGQSGCGKTTLLDLLGLLSPLPRCRGFRMSPPGGRSIDLMRASRFRLAALRRTFLGYVPQSGGLLPCFSARDNIMLTARLARRRSSGELQRLSQALGIHHLLRRLPSELSMGQRQRVAIARALVHAPAVVLADEPTGALDPMTADEVQELFLRTAREMGTAVVIVTHDVERFSCHADHLFGFALQRLGHESVSTVEELQRPVPAGEGGAYAGA